MKQQALLKQRMKELNMNTRQLAEALGKSLYAVRSWLLHEGSAAHRAMPNSAKLHLASLQPLEKARKVTKKRG